MGTITQRVLAALYLSDNVPELIKQCRATIQGMEANASEYPNPTPALSDLKQDVDKLEKAEIYAKTRAKGAAEARDLQRIVVLSKMRQLEAYVQTLADANPGKAPLLILGAAMGIRKPSSHKKADIAATHDSALGVVKLVGRAVKKGRAYYEWEWSTDQESWTSLGRTLEAKATFSDLTPMTLYAFRYRIITKKGTGYWSAVVTLFVK